jgi:hypothetical protein
MVAMSIGDWIVFGFLVLLGILALHGVPSIWRGEHGFLNAKMPAGWPFGKPLWLGWVRSCASIVVLMAVAVVGLPVFLVGAEILGAVLLVGSLSQILVVLVAVTLFNQPKVIVPPPFRRQPGALSTWLGRGRGAAKGRRA